MNALTSITAEIDAETMAIVDSLAAAKGMTGAQFAAEAIRRVAVSEADDQAFVQVGIDAIERGDVVPHSDVMAELDRMIAHHRSRCG